MKYIAILFFINSIFGMTLKKELEKDYSLTNYNLIINRSFSNEGNDYKYSVSSGRGFTNSIVKLDKYFNKLNIVKTQGSGPGEMINPGASCYINDKFYVYDHKRKIINIYDSNLNFIKNVNTLYSFKEMIPLGDSLLVGKYLIREPLNGKNQYFYSYSLFDLNFNEIKLLYKIKGKNSLALMCDIDKINKQIYIVENSYDFIIHIFDKKGKKRKTLTKKRAKIRFSKIELKHNDNWFIGNKKDKYKYSIIQFAVDNRGGFYISPSFKVYNDEDRFRYPLHHYNKDFELISKIDIKFIEGYYNRISNKVTKIIDRKLYVKNLESSILEVYKIEEE